MSLLVTGGAGFIGSNFVLDWLAQSHEPLINLDKLTYAGNTENLQSLNVEWYLDHQEWVANVQSGAYREWVEKNYTQRTA
jgi:dTDP-D-glucose 4,6-dehydratase